MIDGGCRTIMKRSSKYNNKGNGFLFSLLGEAELPYQSDKAHRLGMEKNTDSDATFMRVN